MVLPAGAVGASLLAAERGWDVFDVTTGTRFHPIEMLLSMLIKIVMVVLIGAPVLAVRGAGRVGR